MAELKYANDTAGYYGEKPVGPGAPEPAGPDAEPRPEDTEAGLGTSAASVRLGFIRKVYAILTLQLGVTIGLSCLFIFVLPIREYIVEHPWVIWVGLFLGIGTLIPMICFRTKYPLNFILLIAFTLGFSLLIGSVCAFYFDAGAGVIVLEAFVLTAAIFLSLTAFCLITKKDFSFLGGFLFAALMILILASIANFALGFAAGARSKWFTFTIAVVGALVFTGYILYDTSQIVNKLSPDEYILGAISLYLDVANLFLYLLTILSIGQSS